MINIDLIIYIGNISLGTACGKYFRVCVLSITDAGKFKLNFILFYDERENFS